jgi:hypothetical protein
MASRSIGLSDLPVRLTMSAAKDANFRPAALTRHASSLMHRLACGLATCDELSLRGGQVAADQVFGAQHYREKIMMTRNARMSVLAETP